MINFEFRAHPMMFFKIIKPYLFILILPFIRAIVQFLTKGATNGFFLLEFIAVTFISVLAFCGYKSIKISVKKDNILIERGFFIKSKAQINISQVTSISIKQNIVDIVFSSVTCNINTEAGIFNKKVFEFKLYKNDAKMLSFLLYGVEKTKTIRFSFLKTVLLAAGTSSVVTGLVIGLPIIKKAEDLVNVAISDVFLKEISAVATNLIKYSPIVFNLITILFITAYGTSFLFSFVKKLNFKLKQGKNIINVEQGIVSRKITTFKKQSINNICFEQSVILRIMKKHAMRVSIAGYGEKRGEIAIIAPLISKTDFKNHIKDYFDLKNNYKGFVSPKQDKKTYNRFLFVPSIVFIVTLVVTIVVIIKFRRIDSFVWFLSLVIMIINLYYASICYHNYKNAFVLFDDVMVFSGSSGFKVREMYCQKEKIGIYKILQTPSDRKYRTCKLKVIIRSKSADRVKLKNIDLKSVLQGINSAYKSIK